jgi:hypothetical protein
LSQDPGTASPREGFSALWPNAGREEAGMGKATFETLDGEEIEINSEDVIHLGQGSEEETTLIELEDGSEVTVVATELEVAGELGLNPLEYIDPEDDDESIEELVDEDDDDDEDSYD